MSDPTNNGTSREGSAERVLREGLKANVLAPEALQRIRQATEQEWRAATRAPARRGWRLLSVAASMAILAAGISWSYLTMSSGSGDGAILGGVVSFDAPGLIETRTLRRDVVLAEGSALRVGQTLDVQGDSLVSLIGGGNLRIARASEIELQSDNAFILKRGELYVDIPTGSQAGGGFRVVTDAGEFRHEGTQFAVAIVEGQTRLRVREGSVLWRAGRLHHTSTPMTARNDTALMAKTHWAPAVAMTTPSAAAMAAATICANPPRAGASAP